MYLIIVPKKEEITIIEECDGINNEIIRHPVSAALGVPFDNFVEKNKIVNNFDIQKEANFV
jgi:hypothetical protein